MRCNKFFYSSRFLKKRKVFKVDFGVTFSDSGTTFKTTIWPSRDLTGSEIVSVREKLLERKSISEIIEALADEIDRKNN